ncbi:hypothetical protein FRB94_009657 [Tulasnella sp. JGI-2019a]|nr:hypothetical protein FRB94_009657 [Tulasnella sp. JGI-2019a]
MGILQPGGIMQPWNIDPGLRMDKPLNLDWVLDWVPPFEDSLERKEIIKGVKAAIQNINEIIDLLNHPIDDKGDIIDMDYAPETVASFKVQSAECQKNLTGASTTASAWFTYITGKLQSVTARIGQTQDQINTTDQDIVKNTSQIDANVKAIDDLTRSLTHDSEVLADALKKFNDAKSRYDDAKAEQDRVQTARWFFIWNPVVTLALTLVDVLKEENEVKTTKIVVDAEEVQLKKDQELVAKHGADLKKLQEDGKSLNTALTDLQKKQRELKTSQSQLNDNAERLRPLTVSIDQCIHVVSAALGSASNIDNMMSMNNVGVAIKGVLAALKDDSDFTGAVATFDEQGFAELDKRIQAMQKALKKPI